MAAFSRGLRLFALSNSTEYICSRCLKFSTSSAVQSGHSRWSKIKHDKGAADSKKNVKRTVFAHEISSASKLYGPEPFTNPRLAAAIATAKKAGFPKASILSAIARGQGISASGAALVTLSLEAIMPSSIALLVDIETDQRARALAEIRFIITKRGGTITPTSYLFTKRGVVTFEKSTDEGGEGKEIGVDDVLEEAIEAGAEDLEVDEDGALIVWTEPAATKRAEEALTKKYGLKVANSEIIWDPNEETMVPLEKSDTAVSFMELLDELKDYADVKGVYCNVAQGSIDEKTWAEVGEKLSA